MSERQLKTDGITRRRLLQDAGVAAAGATVIGTYGAGSAFARPHRRKKTVAVFGGGIAGLTAAHELAERGFDVTVYERRAWGGKARSTWVPGSAKGGRKPLPGEHGYRIFFGFYQNTVDTFRRIPFATNPNGVFDNLTPLKEFLACRDGGRRDLRLDPFFGSVDPAGTTPQQVVDLIVGLLLETKLPPDALTWLAGRLVVYFSSCHARRAGQWENVTWSDFARADRYGEDYRRLIVRTFSELFQASKAETTSANFPCKVLEWVVYNNMGRNSNGPTVRSLNLPTNEAFIDPWLRVLRGHGVHLRNGRELKRFLVRDGRISGARVRGPHGMSTAEADWYVCALPVERARRLWNPGILAADPHLGRMHRLDTDWMNGMKFFLRRVSPIANEGVFYCVDAPWTMGAGPQAKLWSVDFASRYGDGQVHDCLSVDISSWGTPGRLFGKTARKCTPKEIAREVWEEMKRHVNDTGEAVLTDDLVHSWDIDPGMIRSNNRLVSDDPLVLPSVGQLADRPDVATAIPNLLLAGDYLKSEWEVANMETASFNGRRAANAILDKAPSGETRAAAIGTYRPPEWEPFKKIDEDRYRRGEPNLFDTEMSPARLNELLNADQRLLSRVG
jgi:uncharacterized protein with NAD-binding domain and iron-sulfur cluster